MYAICLIKKYVAHTRALNQALNRGFRIIKFNQEAWLKQYPEGNDKLRTEVKNNFEKDFFKLINTFVLEKTIYIVTTDKRRNQLVSEPNYRTRKLFLGDLLAIEIKKIKVKISKPIFKFINIRN